MGVNKVHIVQLFKKKKKRLIQVYTWWFKPGRQIEKEEEEDKIFKLKDNN